MAGETDLVFGEEPDTLALVENGVVGGVDRVAPVHVAKHQEAVKTHSDQLLLQPAKKSVHQDSRALNTGAQYVGSSGHP